MTVVDRATKRVTLIPVHESVTAAGAADLFLHVEVCHGVLFTTNCLLLVGKASPSCLGLSIFVSGGFV